MMTGSRRRRRWGAGLLIATLATAASVATATASAEPDSTRKGNRHLRTVQLLSFNDLHGDLKPLVDWLDGSQRGQGPYEVGGAEYLASKLSQLRATAPTGSLTVAAGELIGGSPPNSVLFRDEPTVEALNALGLDVSAVGHTELERGTVELLRMQYGGCHPVDGCYTPDQPYLGANFQWLSANMVRKGNGQPLLPGTAVRTVNGVKVGFIGLTLKETPLWVGPAGISSVEFKDEVETANAQARLLRERGVKAIVALLNEGGSVSRTVHGCDDLSGRITQIAAQLSPEIDQIVSGHTHYGYICSLPDPGGSPRLVTSASSYGRVVTETSLVVNARSGEVDRGRTRAVNHLVDQTTADATQTSIQAKWDALAGPVMARVVGTHTEPILGGVNRIPNIETPMMNLVADAVLWGTRSPQAGGAQIAFVNGYDVKSDLPMEPTYGEAPGEITYAEVLDIAVRSVNEYRPSHPLIVVDLTGDQIRRVLEGQFDPVPYQGARPQVGLGLSEGFSYAWDESQPRGSRVVPGSMKLHGEPIAADTVYRVATARHRVYQTSDFLALQEATNRLGAGDHLTNLLAYVRTHPGLTAPPDRAAGF